MSRPVRWVSLPTGLLVADTPVTQAQYRDVTGESPSYRAGCADCPVEQVSWFDAVAFCNLLSARLGLTPAYGTGYDRRLPLDDPRALVVAWDRTAAGVRLPTEAEWYAAAMAGGMADPYGPLAKIAWHAGNSGGRTHPVATKRPNAYGLYDLLGNVWEWCWDRYAAGNPARVLRGGSWRISSVVGDLRASVRSWVSPSGWDSFLGFRCARGVLSASVLDDGVLSLGRPWPSWGVR